MEKYTDKELDYLKHLIHTYSKPIIPEELPYYERELNAYDEDKGCDLSTLPIVSSDLDKRKACLQAKGWTIHDGEETDAW